MQYLLYGVYLVHVYPRIHMHSTVLYSVLGTLLCYVLLFVHDTRLICGYTDRTD